LNKKVLIEHDFFPRVLWAVVGYEWILSPDKHQIVVCKLNVWSKNVFCSYNTVYFIAQTIYSIISINSNFSVINLLKPIGYVMHQRVLTVKNFTFCHTELVCFVFISQQIATFPPYNANWLVFITQMKSVYSAVRTGSLNKAVCASSLKG